MSGTRTVTSYAINIRPFSVATHKERKREREREVGKDTHRDDDDDDDDATRHDG